MTMTERTNWDDTVDEAIEVLIDEDTEFFALAAVQGQDLHAVSGAEGPDGLEEQLLATFVLIEDTRRRLASEGIEAGPVDTVLAAMRVAGERGYLEGEISEHEV
jgi:hypothetical protein